MGLFRKYWPTCSYEVSLVTDECNEKWEGDIIINCKKDNGWIQNLYEGLMRFRMTDKILLMQEDFFLSDPVNDSVVNRAEKMMNENEAIACTRLMPCPGPDYMVDDMFGIINEDAPYRVSCQAALWRVDSLQKLLLDLMEKHGSNHPGEFEIIGTKMKPAGVYMSVKREQPFPLPYLVSAISRGKWNPDAIKLCKKNNIPINTTRRPVE